MSVHLSPIGNAFQFLDQNGGPLDGGTLATFAAGTSTPAATFTTPAGNVSNTNPIVLGTDGRMAQEIWLTDGQAYKFVLKDSHNNTLATYDNISGIGDPTVMTQLAASSGSSLVGFIQAGASAVARTVQSKDREWFSVTDFGAVGNGVADDAVKIQAAATTATANASGTALANIRRTTLWFPSGYTFLSSVGITVGENVDIIMESPLILTTAAASPVTGLTIGGGNFTRHGRYILDVRRQTQSDWSQVGDIGILLTNLATSFIEIRCASGFRINVAGQGVNNGFTLNRIHIGEIRGGKFNFVLTNSGTGYCNGNNIFGGEIAVGNGEGVNGQSRYGVYITGTNVNNTNMFYGTSFELTLANAGAGEAVCVLIDNASQNNRFYYIRSEGNSDNPISITADAVHNFVWPSFSFRQGPWPGLVGASIADTSKFQTNAVYSYLDELTLRKHTVFDSGSIGPRTNQYDGATAYTVDGFDIADSGGVLFTGQTLIAPSNDDTLTFASNGRNLSRMIDTRVNKRFVAFFDTGSIAQNVNYAVKPFGADGSLLTDNPTPAHVYGEDTSAFSWNGAAVGGSYFSTGANTFPFLYFTVDALTKSAAFIFVSAAGFALKSLRIYALDHPCTSWQMMREREFNGCMIATAIPTADSWTRGDRVYNHTPAAAGTEGWVCTVSGTFGALAGVTATTTNTSQKFTVSSATNLQVGMYITIVGVAGVKRIIGLSGLSATMDVAANASVAGAAVAYQAPTFKTFGTIAA